MYILCEKCFSRSWIFECFNYNSTLKSRSYQYCEITTIKFSSYLVWDRFKHSRKPWYRSLVVESFVDNEKYSYLNCRRGLAFNENYNSLSLLWVIFFPRLKTKTEIWICSLLSRSLSRESLRSKSSPCSLRVWVYSLRKIKKLQFVKSK